MGNIRVVCRLQIHRMAIAISCLLYLR
ncbi:hypothetical protein Ahy_B10g103035 isoform B [Arachis hypogaea]|uniref:Uncharacterized protein n=1 Tax=Arachis hypogaea TaxID=3818 RepID=A0A444X382_ARAHY|nr:hypothetical protein Ahy_B10g103035 isoform B [Arachis hypogaea]